MLFSLALAAGGVAAMLDSRKIMVAMATLLLLISFSGLSSLPPFLYGVILFNFI